MKKIFYMLICFGVIFLFGCQESHASDWEIWTPIKATLTMKDKGKILITYHLGPILIVDDIHVTDAWVHYLNSCDSILMRVYVTEDNTDSCERGLFRYYVEGNFINPTTCCSPIDFPALEQYADDIPGFVWKNGKPTVIKPPVTKKPVDKAL